MKIPFLGDIPFIGGLFRSERETRRRTELIIVLTPRVIRSPDDGTLESWTDSMIGELPLPELIREQIRDGRLKGNDGPLGEAFEPIDTPKQDPKQDPKQEPKASQKKDAAPELQSDAVEAPAPLGSDLEM